MSKLWLALAVTATALTATATEALAWRRAAEVVVLNTHEVGRIHTGVRVVLEDPWSAYFGDYVAAREPGGPTYVCGLVRLSNFRTAPYIGVLTPKGFTVTSLGPGIDPTLMDLCVRYGIVQTKGFKRIYP